jgi:hypothetical protein
MSSARLMTASGGNTRFCNQTIELKKQRHINGQ